MFHMAKLKKQHMTIHWKAIVQDDSSIPATEATLKEKAWQQALEQTESE